MRALIKELAIRRVQHRSETHSNESQHLAEGTEKVARLRRRFSFVLQQALSFRTRHHLCRQGVALPSPRQLRSQGPVSVHAHRTEGITGSEEREGANGVGVGIGVGGGNGDGNGVGAGTGTGKGTEVEVNEGAQDGNGDGSGDGEQTGTGVETRRRTKGGKWDGNENSRGDGNRYDDGNGNEDRIGEGGREAKKRKKRTRVGCRRRVGQGRNLGGKRKKCRKEKVGPVAADPDNLENNKEAGGTRYPGLK